VLQDIRIFVVSLQSSNDYEMFGLKKNVSVKRLLVMRFSAMGDVAMTVPVLYALASQNPQLRITMLTRTRFVPIFDWLPANVQVKGIEFKENDGIAGLTKIYKNLRKEHYDAVADLHDVLRSKYLRTCFALSGVRVAVVKKGRKEKKELIGHGQTHQALQPMTDRYASVFRQLGLQIDLSRSMQLDLRDESFSSICKLAGSKGEGERWVGVAPFAAHAQKVYPLCRMRNVVNQLADSGCKVFLFGAGPKEAEVMASWEKDYVPATSDVAQGAVISTCGRLDGLRSEMLLMSRLRLMISMDSANMHIASIFGIPVLSIWGATHPKAGFSGFGQKPESEMQLDLPCRPCSIYGKTPCQYGDLRCMNIDEKAVVEKAISML
jgi:ADP-heptose:LPS heptosyltransferase